MRELLERRLPGVRFEAEPAPLGEALPRMDVAVFVGFASCGPLHLPVAVEDATQFESIFGKDAPLAWDPLRGERARSLLGSTVRSFFANGGRRCWVIRVAGDSARANCFFIPGLVVALFDEKGEPAGIEPAFARARSEGSWSDGFESAAELRLTAFRVGEVSEGGRVIEFPGPFESAPRAGDLLRLTFPSSRSSLILYAPVEKVAAPFQGSPPGAGVCLKSNHPLWFELVTPNHLPEEGAPVLAYLYSARCLDEGEHSDQLRGESGVSKPTYEATPIGQQGWLEWPRGAPGPKLTLQLSRACVPAPGVLLRLDVPAGLPPGFSPPEGERWWLTVEKVAFTGERSLPPRESISLFGQVVRELPEPPELPLQAERAEILEFDLRVRSELSESYTLRRLGFAPAHPQFWDALPTDRAFYGPKQSVFRRGEVEQSFELERHGQGRTSRGTRFPFAGMELSNSVFLPLGMEGAFSRFLGRSQDEEQALRRDGLASFDTSLFLDVGLADVTTQDFMARADFIRYLSPKPRMLRAMHAALGAGESAIIEEATLIAVSDAVHRGWTPLDPAAPEHWWHELPYERQPERPCDRFRDCMTEVLAEPTFVEGRPPDENGTFLLRWIPVRGATNYRLEEAAFSDFSGAVAVYSDELPEAVLYERSPGRYFYRVRAERGSIVSPWSRPIEVLVGGASGPFMAMPEEFEPGTLLAVHRALLRMCAGRGDLMAVMALPEHYREDDAVAHTHELKRLAKKDESGTTETLLYPSEARAFSYGALYHPWMVSRSLQGGFQSFPPDGAACGVLAARGINRGAWIAPANEPLRDVVALTPQIAGAARQRIQSAQINLVRHDPRGFLVLSADTLSFDYDLRPINVRRLLILLLRLALRRGATYVFEPLSDAFRRMVQRGFEATLNFLFERGAFAGATPAASYRVVTGPEINTPQSLDQGQFFVDLRVAPSLPMTFLTVRLIQAGDRVAAVETR